MSQVQQSLPQTSPNTMDNKRKAPSQARLDKLKKLKENTEKWKSVDLSTSNTAASPKQEYTLELPEPFIRMALATSMVKRRNGEYLPKVHLEDDTRNLKFSLPPMVVKFADLGKEGNLGRTITMKTGAKITIDANKARYSTSLEPLVVPDFIKEDRNSYIDIQREFYEKLDKTCKEMMGLAYHSEDPSWNPCREGKELEEFVNSANYSCMKKATDKNGDEYETIHLARRLTDFQGNPNKPVFWKVNADGIFEVIEPKFIPRGSFIQCCGELRAYKVNRDMYGVSMDLGRDVIVISTPKKEEKPTYKPKVPFINFDY